MVVSERSSDPQLDAFYEDSVIFVDRLEDLHAVTKSLVLDDDWRRGLQEAGLRKYRELMFDVEHLSQALLLVTTTMCMCMCT